MKKPSTATGSEPSTLADTAGHTRDDLWRSLPGGPELLAFLGEVPSFHDGQVIDLHLDRAGPSTLRVHTWSLLGMMTGVIDIKTVEKQAVVTFTIEEIADLKLEGFSIYNIIQGLELRRVRADAPNFGMTWIAPLPAGPDLLEIEMEPIFGISGTIRARHVSITFEPGPPS